MNYKFYFKNIVDADEFQNRVVDIANKYGEVTLSDLYDLTEERLANYLANKYVWDKDTILHDVYLVYDANNHAYCVEFPEPDHYPNIKSVTPRSSVCDKKTSQSSEPLNITILTNDIENIDEVINKVIERANQIKDRPVFVTIS